MAWMRVVYSRIQDFITSNAAAAQAIADESPVEDGLWDSFSPDSTLEIYDLKAAVETGLIGGNAAAAMAGECVNLLVAMMEE